MTVTYPVTISPAVGSKEVQFELFTPPSIDTVAIARPTSDNPGIPERRSRGPQPRKAKIDIDSDYEWSDVGVQILRNRLLWHSMEMLSDRRAGKRYRQECLDWIMSDDMHPFSFVVCAETLGYKAAVLRTGTMNYVEQQLSRSGLRI